MAQLGRIDNSYMYDTDASSNDWARRDFPIPSIADRPNGTSMEHINVSQNGYRARSVTSTRSATRDSKDKNQGLETAFTNLQAEHNRLLQLHQTVQSTLTDIQAKNTRLVKIESSVRELAEHNKRLSADYAAQQLTNSRLQDENMKLRQQSQQRQQKYQEEHSKHQKEINHLKRRLQSQTAQLELDGSSDAQETPSEDSTHSTTDRMGSLEKDVINVNATTYGHTREHMNKATRKWLCSMCERLYSRKEHLRRHERSVHMNHKPYLCTICNRSFSRADHLRNHARRSHTGVIVQSIT